MLSAPGYDSCRTLDLGQHYLSVCKSSAPNSPPPKKTRQVAKSDEEKKIHACEDIYWDQVVCLPSDLK